MEDLSLLLTLVKGAWSVASKAQEYRRTREILESSTTDLDPMLGKIQQHMKKMDLPTEQIEKLKGITEANREVLDKNKLRWWNFCLFPYFGSKQDEAYQNLLSYCSIQLPVLTLTTMMETLSMQNMELREIRSLLAIQTTPRLLLAQETNNRNMPIFYDSLQIETINELTLRLDGQVHSINVLKHELLRGEQQVLNLYGLPGSGKTTLAQALCVDHQVKEKFRGGIVFVKLGSQVEGDEAIKQLQDKLSERGVHPALLVLDDVRFAPEKMVEKLKVSLSLDSKILVTSRFQVITPSTLVYPMESLSDTDAETLLLHFVEPRNIDFGDYEIREILKQIIRGCKGLPWAIEFIGRELYRKRSTEAFQKWRLEWSRDHNILDANAELLDNLQNYLHLLVDKSIKECFMDLGLFPEDQKIPITVLIDMWIELYDLDERGVYAMTFIQELIALNLAAGIKVRRIVGSDADNYYNNHFLMQHDLFRKLTIRVSNEEPFENRKRLIIDMNGNHQPEWWPHQQEQGIHAHPLSYFTKWLKDPNQHKVDASILSMSSDQATIPDWCNIQAADVVVLILNIKTREYTLPEFIKKMKNLKVLILTNYGFDLSRLENLELLGSIGRLKRIRLQQVSVHYLCKLKNVHKLSLYMCEVSRAFGNNSIEFSKVMPNLGDLNIDYCKDLVMLPPGLCKIVTLKKLSISSCHKFTELPQEIGKLENLELLRISYCAEFKEMPESIRKLKNLSFLDISYCVSLRNLPDKIGELQKLEKLYMTGCPIRELPESVIDLKNLKRVICDEDTFPLWEVVKSCCSELNIKKAAMGTDLNWLS